MKPLVSILIPGFNHEKYINDCLDSVLALNYPRIEVLIMDDASTDRTYAFAELYRERLERRAERVLIEANTVNLGICKNCNKLWNLANGDYFKFIASDDILMPDGIDYLVDYFEKHPECNIVHGNVGIIDEKDDYLGSINKNPVDRGYVPGGYHLTAQLMEKNFIFAPSAMISKATKEKFGIFSEKYSYEDEEYWLRVSVEGRIDYIDRKIVAYRELPGSASHINLGERKKRLIALRDSVCIFESYKKYASPEAVNRYYNNAIKNAFLCEDHAAIEIINKKFKENKVRFSIKTGIWILAYKMGLYKPYRKYRVWCEKKVKGK